MRLPLLSAALIALSLPAFAQKMQTPAGEAPGPWILGTIGVGKGDDPKTPKTTALKGIAIKVGEHGEAAVAYDLDLCRMAGAWTGKFTTPMNLMSRGEYPTAMGEVAFTTGEVPGFAAAELPHAKDAKDAKDETSNSALRPLRPSREESSTSSAKEWKDPRSEPFGPLPPGQARFRGFYVNGDKTILKWDIGGVEVLEMPVASRGSEDVRVLRVMMIGPSDHEITILVCRKPPGSVSGGGTQATVLDETQEPPQVRMQLDWIPLPVGDRATGIRDTNDPVFKKMAAEDPNFARELTKLVAQEQVGKRIVDRFAKSLFEEREGNIWLRIPPSDQAITCALRIQMPHPSTSKADKDEWSDLQGIRTLAGFIRGGPARWPEPVVTTGELSKDTESAYVVDTIKLPDPNPWGAPMFVGGVDFFEVGSRKSEVGRKAATPGTSDFPHPTSHFPADAAVCTFHGDVFLVSGLDEKLEKVTWKRFASGLYHALGLKIVNGEIYVTCRDGIWRLKDLNGDGEADFYEAFNFDVKVTKSFHEFVFDLQTDPAGNFYFAKAGPVKNGGRGFDEIMAHHGSLFRVSPDGKNFEVVATGFRAPNGIGVGPHGELTSGDNEGTWTPVCKINWIKPGGFYGVVPLAHRDPPPSDYDRPLCWLPKRVDNSGGGQVWAPEGERWGPWGGRMLHLSYGQSSLYGVLVEPVPGWQSRTTKTVATADKNGLKIELQTDGPFMQGGVTKFPLQFQSGIMRARFNPKDGQLFVAGLRGWQTSGLKNGCLQRVRYTGAETRMPIELHVKKDGLELRFTTSLDTQSARDPENWQLEQWRYLWSAAYGSPELSTATDPEAPAEAGKDGDAQFTKAQMGKSQHDPVAVKSVTIGTDDRTVFLEIPGLKPVMQMSIKYNLKAADGKDLRGEVVNTIHALGE